MNDETSGTTPAENAGGAPGQAAGEAPGQAAGGPPGQAADGASGPPAGGDVDKTMVAPTADEGATQVLAGESVDATQVMPAAGAGRQAPPQDDIQPTLMMSHAHKSDGGSRTWIWVVVAILVVAAIAAGAWYFVLRSPASTTVSSEFVGSWTPVATMGGGLEITGSGSSYVITQYDASLSQVGKTNATLEGDALKATIDAAALGLTGATGTVQATLTIDSGNGQLVADLTAGTLSGKSVHYMRVDVLRPAPPTAPATPTITPTTTGSPSPTTTGSPTPTTTGSPSADDQVMAGIIKIQVGIITWATNNNNLYPTSGDVNQGGGIGQYVSPWPTNPFTNMPMIPGTDPGNYTYEQLNGGQAYKLTGYLSKGLTYTVP